MEVTAGGGHTLSEVVRYGQPVKEIAGRGHTLLSDARSANDGRSTFLARSTSAVRSTNTERSSSAARNAFTKE